MRRQLPESLSRDDSMALKGIAIVLMIMHHVLIKDYYINPDTGLLNNHFILRLMVLGKVCVGLFMFVTAYGYAMKPSRDMRYSLSHVMRLLVRYWALLVVFIALGYYAGHRPQSHIVLLNLVGLSSAYSCANWYVYFYIYAMIALPLLSWLVQRYRLWTLLAAVLMCGAASYLLHRYCSANMWLTAIRECVFYTPLLVAGCYLARFGWPFDTRRGLSTIELLLTLVATLAVGSFSRDIYGFCTFTVLVPVMAWTMVALLRQAGASSLRQVLVYLGQLSLYMWFIHAVFFSSMTRSLFQQSALWPRNLALVYLLVFSISLVVSTILVWLERSVSKKIK